MRLPPRSTPTSRRLEAKIAEKHIEEMTSKFFSGMRDYLCRYWQLDALLLADGGTRTAEAFAQIFQISSKT